MNGDASDDAVSVDDAALVAYTALNGVARITLTRSSKLNALTPEIYRLLGEFIQRATDDDQVGVVVLSGEGRAFAAGADIEFYVDLPEGEFRAFVDSSRAVVDLFAACPKPIVAVVQGYALGGGFELALACDLVVAADNARFGLPEARLGLLPGGGGTQRLPRLIGRVRANELIMTGRLLTAQEALEWGVVNVVCPSSELADAVDALLRRLFASAPAALGVAKDLIAHAGERSLSEGLQHEADETVPLISTADAREGIRAFVGKREPRFAATRTAGVPTASSPVDPATRDPRRHPEPR